MTEESTRKRGRPSGSGKKDGSTLMEVARLMIRDPNLKPTTAMKRVYTARKPWLETQETLVRRLQEKWRAQGQAMLTRARQEREPAGSRSMTVGEFANQLGRPIPWLDPKLMERIANIDRIANVVASVERSMRGVLGSPQMLETVARLDKLHQRIAPHLTSASLSEWQKKIETANAVMQAYPWLQGGRRREDS